MLKQQKNAGWIALAAIICTAIFLRFGRFDLIEFKDDEATSMQLALDAIHNRALPLFGLMSSVHVVNPPLFIDLLIPVLALCKSLAFMTAFIASTGTAAVIVCWHIGRKYYSTSVGLIAAALFAVSPWAVVFSRKIWAQDLVPLFAALALWATHALVLGRNRRAIFWVVLLPLCVIQIHFSGFAMAAAICCILLLLRPAFDWRFAAGGAVAAFILLTPYLYYQAHNGWADFRQATQIVRGNPFGGASGGDFRYLKHALGVVNGGEMDALLQSDAPKFEERLTFENLALGFQRFIFVSAVVYLALLIARGIRWSKKFPWATVESDEAKTSWILVCWVVVPLAIYAGVRLSTMLSYYVLFYPVPYLLCAVIWHKLWAKARRSFPAKGLLCAVLGIVLAANFSLVLNLYAFLAGNGGSHEYGTILRYKRQAVAYLAGNTGMLQLQKENRLVEMDRFGRLNSPRLDFSVLATLAGTAPATPAIPPDTAVIIIDRYRTKFTDEQWSLLAGLPRHEFGPIQLYFLPASRVTSGTLSF
ncbi:MAG: hypothetical protein WCD79_17855 [Chthoniobacteraceae bacterium]